MANWTCYATSFEGRRKGQDPRNVRDTSLKAGEYEQMDFPLETSERTRLGLTL